MCLTSRRLAVQNVSDGRAGEVIGLAGWTAAGRQVYPLVRRAADARRGTISSTRSTSRASYHQVAKSGVAFLPPDAWKKG